MASRGRGFEFLRLVRFSLAPTLVADLAAGLALAVAPARLPLDRLLIVLPCSLLLFVAGMSWNAWLDREEDARTRPDRPVPSGRIAASTARRVALAGFTAAPLLGFLLGGEERRALAGWLALLAGLILTYHTPLRRSPWLGPLVLGAVRAVHLLTGAVVVLGVGAELTSVLPAAGLYGGYVAGASLVAHQEDRAVARHWVLAGVALGLAAIVGVAALAFVPPPAGLTLRLAVLAVVLWHAGSVVVALRRLGASFTPTGVEGLARVLLGRMALLTAALALSAGSALGGALALLCYQAVRRMVRVIPPT